MRTIVMGGGVCGLTAAMMLARDGHAVTVLERDPDPVPASPQEAWERWPRRGVAQFRQAHVLQGRGHAVLEEALPDVAAALGLAGTAFVGTASRLPPSITDRSPRPGDERLGMVSGRRTTIEQVVAHAAEREPGVEVRRGVSVRSLMTAAAEDPPQVVGVRTDAGETLHADLVVDASGRRSELPRLLAEAGAEPPAEETEGTGFVYYSRFFRSGDGSVPQWIAAPNSPVGSFSVLTLPADDGIWSVTVYGSARDRPLKALRDEARWTAVVAACPLHAHWLEGEPLTGVLPMGGPVGRARRLVADGEPVATGVVALADAAAYTNPSLGRGIALGLLHAQRLREVVRTDARDPRALAEAWDADTEAELAPWYRETVEEDRRRLAEMEALRTGHPAEKPTEPETMLRAALPIAAPRDADVFRAFLETRCCRARADEVLARPGMADRVLALAGDLEPVRFPGPGREELLALLA